MQKELNSFAAFYNEKNQGHKLEWNYALGTVSLRARFAAGLKELSVSLYQAVILLLFNDMEEMLPLPRSHLRHRKLVVVALNSGTTSTARKLKNLGVAVMKYEERVAVQRRYSWAQSMMG